MRDDLADLLREPECAAQSVLVEQNSPDTPTENMRPDIVFHDHRGWVRHIDVEICTPYLNRTPHYRPGALIEQLEAVKRRKYMHLPLTPFVMSHLGRIGTGATGLLKSVYRDADDSSRSKCINRAYQTIACVVQKRNVTILSSGNSLIASTDSS